MLATQSVLRNPIDYSTLSPAKVVTLVSERCLDVPLEPSKRMFVTADECSVDGVVCDVERKCFNVRDVDEGSIFLLEISRQKTPLLEPFAV